MNTRINDKVFESFPVLETDRLILREFDGQDAEDLFFIRSNHQIMEFMDTDKFQSIIEADALIIQIKQSFKDKNGINWAIVEKSSNEVIGYFGYWRLIREHCRAEIGFALKPKSWSKGYMKEAIREFIRFGFNEFQLHSIEANANPKNGNSKKLLEKLGFKKEAYFRENYYYDGKFIDSEIYCLLESDC